jgi:hypothetical protein
MNDIEPKAWSFEVHVWRCRRTKIRGKEDWGGGGVSKGFVIMFRF